MIGIVHNGHAESHTYFVKGIAKTYTSITSAAPEPDPEVAITKRFTIDVTYLDRVMAFDFDDRNIDLPTDDREIKL